MQAIKLELWLFEVAYSNSLNNYFQRSYGIVLWGIFTGGVQPYTGLENVDIDRYLTLGNRLSQPELAPDYMYAPIGI